MTLDSSERRLVSGSWDKKMLIWDLDTGNITNEYNEHKSQINTVEFKPIQETSKLDQNILLSCGVDGGLQLFDLRLKKKILTANTSKCPPWAYSACFSNNGNSIYAGRRNCCVEEFDIRANKFTNIYKMPLNSGPITSVSRIPNENAIVW